MKKIFLILTGLILAGIQFARAQDAPVAQPVYPPVARAVSISAPPPGAPVDHPTGYKLKAGDAVHIRVFQEDDLETTGKLDEDGIIFFPLLGKAKIGGETVQEATTTMEQLLREYLLHPQVSVEITAYAKLHFTVLGQVNKPGIFDFPDEGKLDLLEALGMAGGYTKIANADKILIKRMVNGQETVINVRGKKLLDKHNTTQPIPEILPGDTISIGEAMF